MSLRSKHVLLVGILATWPRLSGAQPGASPGAAGTDPGAPVPGSSEGGDPGKRDAAREKFQRGVQAYQERRYREAIDLLLEADGLMHNAAFDYNIGVAYEAMGDVPSALRWLRDYLREAPEAEDRVAVEQRIGRLETALQERGVQQATVLSKPEAATVVVDGKPVGVTPWTGELLPGRHDVTVQLRGYADSQRYIDVRAHRADDFPFELAVAEKSESAPATSARAVVPAKPEAERESPGHGVSLWTWGAFGVGALALGGAAVFEASRASAVDDARKAPQVDYRDRLDGAKSRQTTARILAGVGGAFIVTGGVLLYLDLSKGSSPVAVGCGGSGCYGSARGTF